MECVGDEGLGLVSAVEGLCRSGGVARLDHVIWLVVCSKRVAFLVLPSFTTTKDTCSGRDVKRSMYPRRLWSGRICIT